MHALVDPADTLSIPRRRLGSRTAALRDVGETGLRRLAAARVLVVGAGGLGSPVVALLAGSGLHRLTVVDPDVVDASNLARQTLFTAADVGVPKADAAAERARSVDPELEAVAVVGSFSADLVAGHDVVVDAADSVAVTRSISDACAAAGVPFVWGTALATDGQASVFWDAGPDGGVDFHDLHSEPMADEASCAVDGVVPALCATIGSLMAGQVVALVTGVGEPLYGRLVTVDADRWRWVESPLRRGPGSRRPAPGASGASGAFGSGAFGLEARGGPVPRLAPAALADRLAADSAGPAAVVLVDVRTAEERAEGMIPGAVTPDALPPIGDVVVYCATGPRADAWAAAHQDRTVAVLDGGMRGWRAEGRAVLLP